VKPVRASQSLYIRILIFAFIIFVSINIHHYSDYQTTLSDGMYIRASGGDIKTGLWSVPVVADWDQDTNKDLLVGSRQKNHDGTISGRVSFFRNYGSDNAPQFNDAALITFCKKLCTPLGIAAEG